MESTAYFLQLKGEKNPKIYFQIGGTDEHSVVLTLEGKKAREYFEKIISLLSRYGGAVPEEITPNFKKYAIREDLGPVIGAFMLMIRRTQNVTYWIKLLEGLLEGRYVGLANVYVSLLQRAIELSSELGNEGKIEGDIADAISSALKAFTKKAVTSRQFTSRY